LYVFYTIVRELQVEILRIEKSEWDIFTRIGRIRRQLSGPFVPVIRRPPHEIDHFARSQVVSQYRLGTLGDLASGDCFLSLLTVLFINDLAQRRKAAKGRFSTLRLCGFA
jgi:hypothetical protein